MSQSSNLKSPAKELRAPIVSHPIKAASIKLPELQETLKKVASARSKFHVRKVGMLVRWENDNTGAEKDLDTMGAIMKSLGVQSNKFIIPKSAEDPSWNLIANFQKLFEQCTKSSLPSLFIFYYAGHASYDESLYFTSGDKSILWRTIASHLEAKVSVDSLIILDCCHAGAAARQPASPRNIHLMAACGAHEITSQRSYRTSFTQRLFRAMQAFRTQGSFTTAEWYERLQIERPKNAPYPVFETLSGTGSIGLVWSGSGPSRIPRPMSGVSQKHVLVKLTLEGQRDAVESFSKAIRQLPPNMKVEICGAFETDASVLLIIHMSWQGWVLWSNVVPLDFIGVALGPALLPRVGIPPVLASEENVPLGNLSLKEKR